MSVFPWRAAIARGDSHGHQPTRAVSILEQTQQALEHEAKVTKLLDDKARQLTDWRKKLRGTANGKALLGDVRNVLLALENAPELAGLLRFNELSKRIEFTRAPPWRTLTRAPVWLDDDDVDLAGWLQQWAIPVRGDVGLARIVHAHAAQFSYHPVRDWLTGLEWDGEPRIGEVLLNVLSATGDARYITGVLRRFMLSAVARAMEPGCKVDHMLVLVGAQGLQKSTFARELCAPWSQESNSTFGTKDAIAELEGVWLMEVPELSSMRRPEIETVKSFVSKRSDHYRPAYGRAVIDQPRTCVFIGTTNEEKFLLDYTGNRRFWPLVCGARLDVALLRAERLKLWAEALAAYRAGEQWYLTREEERLALQVQEAHRIVTEVEEDVTFHLEGLASSWRARQLVAKTALPPLQTTVKEVFRSICGERELDSLNARRQMETAIGQAIRRTGWHCLGRKGGERRTTYEYKPASPASPEGGDY